MNKRDTFHHGDLRAALIEAALDNLEQAGADGLSLRQLAKTIGVAPSAPFKHFANKQQLVDELWLLGIAEIKAAYIDILHRYPAGERLKRACIAYVQFAVRRPALFRLIFTDGVVWRLPDPALSSGPGPHGLLTSFVAELMPTADEMELGRVTLCCWSAIHGFATLRISGRLGSFAPDMVADDPMLDIIAAIPLGHSALAGAAHQSARAAMN